MRAMLRLAAPSCVIPDRVGPNCATLASLVREVGFMLLETQGCLDYDERDLPPDLPDLGLSYHAHLPVDLPWARGAAEVARGLCDLERKIAFTRPWGYVLHPPRSRDLENLLWLRPDLGPRLCLENTCGHDLSEVWSAIEAHDLGVCLDLGHLVSYGQEQLLLRPGIFERVRIMHIYGGESAPGHAGLDQLPDPDLLRRILTRLTRPCVLVVEIFHMEEFLRSLALLRSWLDTWGMSHD